MKRRFWKSGLIPSPKQELIGLLLSLILLLGPGAAEPSKLILALGDDSYPPAQGVKAWTGPDVKKDLGKPDLNEDRND